MAESVLPAVDGMEGSSITPEDEELFCVCQKKYEDGVFMFECERGIACNHWVHPECCNVLQADVPGLQDYVCPGCRSLSPTTPSFVADDWRWVSAEVPDHPSKYYYNVKIDNVFNAFK